MTSLVEKSAVADFLLCLDDKPLFRDLNV